MNRPLMYAAQAFELGCSGLGTGAFGVLLLRLTQKRFSATQYALLSSLFTLPRVLAGPVAGVARRRYGLARLLRPDRVHRHPRHVMLARFVPWGVREVRVRGPGALPGTAACRGGARAPAAAGALAPCSSASAALAARGRRSGRCGPGAASRPCPRCAASSRPRRGRWPTLAGLVVLAVLGGLATAATLVARPRPRALPGGGIARPPRAYHGTEGTRGGRPVSKS